MKEVVCGIVFILCVDYKCSTNPYSWIKREKMSDHYFKFTPIDRFNNFNRYVKFDKFNKIDKFDRFDKFFWYNKFCWFDKSDIFDKVDIIENLKDMPSFTVLNKRSYCIIGWDKNFKIYTGKYEKKGSFLPLYMILSIFLVNFKPLFHIFLYPFLKRGLHHLNQWTKLPY